MLLCQYQPIALLIILRDSMIIYEKCFELYSNTSFLLSIFDEDILSAMCALCFSIGILSIHLDIRNIRYGLKSQMGVIWYYYNYGSTRALHAQEETRRVSYLVINVSGTDDNSNKGFTCVQFVENGRKCLSNNGSNRCCQG